MSYDTNEFRNWLKTAMKNAGVDNQSALATASFLGQAVVSSYLSGARRPERRDEVEKLVRALLPPGGGALDAKQLLDEGLRAAGLIAPLMPAGTGSPAASRPSVTPISASDPAVIIYLRGKPEALQEKALRILKAVFED